MKFISLEMIGQSFLTIIYRFPYALLCTFMATISAIWLVQHNFEQVWLLKIFQTTYLGALLFLAIRLFLENVPYAYKISRSLLTGGFIFLVLYYLSLGSPLYYSEYIRFLVLILAFHLLISFAPYILQWKEQNGFWHYNQAIFIRVLSGSLYTGVLYVGLLIALWALEKLFEFQSSASVYYGLGIFILGFFQTNFILAGIPQDFTHLNHKDDYPQELKFFTQFVLLPLVAIYLIILYIYGFQMLIPWNLPKGWVAYLIIIFSICGIFSLLLIHPLLDQPENRWMRIFLQIFYLTLIPLIFLLLISIQRRIADYGMTELRYYVGLIMFWLLGIAIYFLTSRRRNIQFIPISLCILLILSAWGPWGAVSISRHSQLNRLEKIWKRADMLESQRLSLPKAQKAKISPRDLKETEAILDFLNRRGRLVLLQPYFSTDLDSLLANTLDLRAREETIIQLIGNQALNDRLNLKNTRDQINFSSDKSQKTQNIRGFDYLIQVEQYALANKPEIHTLGKQEIEINGDFEEGSLRILQKKSREVLLRFDLHITVNNLIRYHLKKSHDIPLAEMTLIEESLNYQAKLILDHVGVIRLSRSKSKLTGLSGTIYLKLNE